MLADPAEWEPFDPWSGMAWDGCVWGRGALDMKSQVAAEVAAALSLADEGWRPTHGELKLVLTADEEAGAEHGARFLCEQHPDKVRADIVINEGAGRGLRVRRSPSLRRLRGGEGRVPLHALDGGQGRPRLDPAYRRQRPHEDGAGAGGAGGRPRHAGALTGARRVPRSDRCGLLRPRGRAAGGGGRESGDRDPPRADAGCDAHADDDSRLGEDQRHPLPGRAEGGLPRAAGAGQGARARTHPRRGRPERLRGQVRRDGGGQPLSDGNPVDGVDSGLRRSARIPRPT